MASLQRNQQMNGIRGWLRATAEERVARSPELVNDIGAKTPGDLIYELKVNQIELEIQNEVLKKSRQESEESMDRLLDLIDSVSAGYFILTDEAYISHVNQPGAALLGIERKYLNRDRFRSHLSPDSLKVWDRFFLHVLKQNKKQTCTLSLRQSDGTIIYTRAEGVRMEMRRGAYLVGVVMSDISEMKQIDTDLRESEERYRILFQEAPVPYQSLDVDGRVLDANKAWLRMLGYERDEVIGSWFGDYLPLDQKKLFREQFSFFMKNGEIHDSVFPMQKKNAEIILVSLVGNIGYYPDGSFRQAYCVLQDVTSQKGAEDALRESEEILKSSLSEKDILLREIHHRVKNNLASIISLINLQMASFPSDRDKSHYQDLEARIRSMALVYESLYQEKNITQISIQTYIKNLLQYLIQIYMKRQDIDIRFDIDSVRVSLDTIVPCGLVLNEIITNALKYAFPPGFPGEEERGIPCTISISVKREESDLILIIADNGVGISPEIISSHQTLGLYLIDFIISHQLRGKVDINTSCGTRYLIKFPALDDEVSTQ